MLDARGVEVEIGDHVVTALPGTRELFVGVVINILPKTLSLFLVDHRGDRRGRVHSLTGEHRRYDSSARKMVQEDLPTAFLSLPHCVIVLDKGAPVQEDIAEATKKAWEEGYNAAMEFWSKSNESR